VFGGSVGAGRVRPGTMPVSLTGVGVARDPYDRLVSELCATGAHDMTSVVSSRQESRRNMGEG